MNTVSDPFKHLIRRPALVAERLILNAYTPVRWVSEIRVRWKPAAEGTNKPLGHFVLVQLVFGGEADHVLDAIEKEIGVRIAAAPFDLCLERLSATESLKRDDFSVILRRDWDWYYAHGYNVPGRISGQGGVDIL